jgi:hypothetical protein
LHRKQNREFRKEEIIPNVKRKERSNVFYEGNGQIPRYLKNVTFSKHYQVQNRFYAAIYFTAEIGNVFATLILEIKLKFLFLGTLSFTFKFQEMLRKVCKH